MPETVGLVVTCVPGPGVLHELTGVIARHKGDIISVDIVEYRAPATVMYLEIELPDGRTALVEDIRALPVVRSVEIVESLQRVYGKRIIIMGGGAQVGQVAIGAISEADRHNIRGEHISCLLYTSPSPRDGLLSRMPSSA